MKILFISMPSVHFVRWIENLKDTNYELYWFDITNAGKIKTDINLIQYTDWKKRKIKYIKGEEFLRKKSPTVYNKIESFLQITANEKLETIIKEMNPDIIHSFEMQNCSYPIYRTMKKYPNIKWVYSCWGSDLFYYKDFKQHKGNIEKILSRINFLHTDCERDYKLAKALGFKGEFLGIIPGGGGYHINKYEDYILPLEDRKIILIKGYEHQFGKAINVVKAISIFHNLEKDIEVVIFGAHQKLIDYLLENNLQYKFYGRHDLTQFELMELMGRSILYIGNSTSDGIPNTLIEAVIMQVFPIQSNPGNVTAEIIENKKNGLLVNNPNDVNQIKEKILFALNNMDMLKQAMIYNKDLADKKFSYDSTQKTIINMYSQIHNLN